MVNRYAIVVIGGGIHGAGVAQAAAAAGHRVLVIERTALAAGTSGHSSKLIHGGLRYLEHGHLGLVRQCLRERELLLTLAPELVRLAPFYIPVYEHSYRSPRLIRSGLALYALLAGMTRHSRFSMVPRNLWSTLDGLDTFGLKAVFRYWDGRTDDVALTRAVMASARALGAELWMPAVVEDGELTEEGAILWCRMAGRIEEVQARVVVNAAGPWARRVLNRFRFVTALPEVELVVGSHLLVKGNMGDGVYYMESPEDRRPVFAMSWQNSVMVGTTEQPWSGDPDRVTPSDEEKKYLHHTLARHFPDLANQETLTSFAGLRVLPVTGAATNSKSRETLLWTDRPEKTRLLTIFGGKLTAYRATAETVMTHLSPQLPETTKKGDSKKIMLHPVA